MTQTTISAPLNSPILHGPARLRELPSIYMELGKARLSGMVVATTGVGYVLGSGAVLEGTGINWLQLLWTVIGTALAAGSANALNQVWERERDSLMRRTQGRPLPSGRIGTMHAVAMAVLAGGWGVTLLAALVSFAAAGLALLTLLLYVFVYTPMKTRSTLNTMVGGIVGAVPPMIGWVAATGSFGAGAWVLGAILFIWQIPHFLALAWMYRKDYEIGGYRMLPIIDPSGRLTSHAALMWSVALLPLGVVAAQVGMTGWLFAVASLALTLWLVKLAWGLTQQRNEAEAKRLFLGSVIYLPLLLIVMVVDRSTVVEADWPEPTTVLQEAQPPAEPTTPTLEADETAAETATLGRLVQRD
ncbi:MAG: heme o synthase [Phycisphaeraceae bacterium]